MYKGIFSGLFVGLGIFVTGFLVSKSIDNHTYYGRSISVKGLSERDIVADLGRWTLRFQTVGNDIKLASQEVEALKRVVINGLLAAGFSESEINAQQPIETDDLMADKYNKFDPQKQSRYILKASIDLETNQVEKLFKSTYLVNNFIGQGVVFVGGVSPVFFYSDLNTIKPDMLKEAGQNAYAAALELANNTKSKIGKIQSASQGAFSIRLRTDTDEYEGYAKHSPYLRARVVTNVTYFIVD